MVTGAAFAETVRGVSVTGNQRMDSESVRLLANIRVGDNLDAEGVNQVVKRLQNANLFSGVRANLDGGVLKIAVTEAPVVNMVTVEGNDEVSTDDLKKEIRLKERSAYDESVIGADVARMLTIYQRKGFFGTRIEPQKIKLADNRVNVVYEIAEGHPTYIKSIEFTGNEKFSARTLRGEVMSREHAWWRFLSQFDVYDEDRIQYDQQLLRQFYARQGYADFQIKSVNGVFTPDRQYYSVTFDVDEGPRYKFGALKIENPFPDVEMKDLEKKLDMREGDTYNMDKVESTISALRGAVADHGYAFVNVDVVPDKNDEKRTIGLDFKIQKTNRVYINNLSIIGNVRTFDSVIERQMDIRAGDPFSLQTIEAARQRMMSSKFFKSVEMVPTRVADSNLMNLDVKVEEQPTGELSGGIGWSNINGFMIDAGITENNFMGRGQIVQLRANWAQYSRQVMASFTEPYVFGRDLMGGLDASYTMYNYSSLGSFGYDRDSLTFGGRLGWKLTDNWSQTLRLSATFDQNFDLHAPGGWEKANLYTVGTNFRYYNLNKDFAQQTQTGVVANFGAAYTGFGSTETFMRYNADVTGLYNFFDNRWQLKSSLEFGLIQPMGDQYIARVYRYFLGGDSLRGFELAGVGSRNWYYSTYALGGMWKLNGSTQLNFPIFIPDEYQVKGFVFLDYGILGRPPRQEDTFAGLPNYIDQDLRASYGIGVYWNTPMGPMNFSWGWPISLQHYDREQRFLLSFATQF